MLMQEKHISDTNLNEFDSHEQVVFKWGQFSHPKHQDSLSNAILCHIVYCFVLCIRFLQPKHFAFNFFYSVSYKQYNLKNACIVVGKADKVLDHESERKIYYLLTTTVYHAPTVCFACMGFSGD